MIVLKMFFVHLSVEMTRNKARELLKIVVCCLQRIAITFTSVHLLPYSNSERNWWKELFSLNERRESVDISSHLIMTRLSKQSENKGEIFKNKFNEKRKKNSRLSRDGSSRLMSFMGSIRFNHITVTSLNAAIVMIKS